MRRFAGALLVGFALVQLAASPGSAQPATAGCRSDQASDPDQLIAACTAELQSSNDVSRQIEALLARASAYTAKHRGDLAVAD